MNNWLNYDLHMHSYASCLKKTGDKARVKKMSAKDFIGCFLDQIDVFSVTDHNYFDKDFYNELFMEIEGGRLRLIKGTELDVYVDNIDFFHMGVYFEDSTDSCEISKIIDELYKNGAKPKLGDIIQQMFSLKKKFLIMPEADKSRGINSVWEAIKRNGEIDRFLFNGRYRIFNGYDSKDDFNIEGASKWALSYYKKTKEFETITNSMSQNDIKDLLIEIGKKIKDENYLLPSKQFVDLYDTIKEYGQAFAYFSFSDWHNAEKYDHKINNYVYGSLNNPFETLELAVLDPFSRIDVTKDKKSIPGNYIKNISFKIKDRDYSVDFDTGLNSIVGKRACGKSLLMSIIQKMSDITDTQLDKYCDKGKKKTPWVLTDSIKCKLFDGTVLKAGQLQSIEYINQNSIKEIFDNPDKANETIQTYFPEIAEIDTEPLNKIIELLKTIKPFNNNYKSFTTYLNKDKEFNAYVYKKISGLNYAKVQGYFNSLNNTFSNIFDELTQIGFKGEKIKQLHAEVNILSTSYLEMINHYNILFSEINAKTSEMSNSASATQIENETMMKEYYSSKEVIFNNFEILLKTKKVIHLIENFNINIPPVSLRKKSKYIFLTFYDIKESLKDLLITSIQDLFKSTKKNGPSVILDYINGIGLLKSGLIDLWSKLDSKFIIDNVNKKKAFYVITQDFDISTICTFEDVNSKVSAGLISDISSSSLGDKSSVYLELMLELDKSIFLFDQPEDNVDNDYISNKFVPLLKKQKKTKQLIFVTHNPSVAVYTDSFNYIYCTNDNEIEYKNYFIERIKDKEKILDILDGGPKSFSNRNGKYGNVIGEYK